MWVETRDRRSLCSLGTGGFAAEMSFCLDLREGEGDGLRISEFRECINPWTAGITEPEKLGDFVECFAGGVVDGAADERVGPCAVCRAREEEVSVSAGDDEGEGWIGIEFRAIPGPRIGTWGTLFSYFGCCLALLKEDRMDVAFEVIDGDQGKFVGESESLGVRDADE